VDHFVREFELQILDQKKLLDLDIALKVTPTILWVTHKARRENLQQCKRLLQFRFRIETEYFLQQYTRLSYPRDHITHYTTTWSSVPKQE
jgi:hypothetical protein